MSFPRQYARTRRFSLGVPRGFVSGTGPTGPCVLFLRTDAGDDPVTHLYRFDVETSQTTKLVDARALPSDQQLSQAECARRERAREQASGIVAFSVDRALTRAAFSVGGDLFTVEVASGTLARHHTPAAVFDPRISDDGSRVAFHANDGLHLVDLPDDPSVAATSRLLVDEPEVVWGRAEFVAAEEMGRSRGFWFCGDGRQIALTRVDERGVARWTIADPANPQAPATEHRYPAAGTTNAKVSLWVLDIASGRKTLVPFAEDDEYLAHVSWGRGPLTALLQPREQTSARVVTVDPDTGAVTERRRWHDRVWIELVPGTPVWADGALVTIEDRSDLGAGGTRALCVDGQVASPAGLQIRALRHVAATPAGIRAAVLASGPDMPETIRAYYLDIVGPGDSGDVDGSGADPGIEVTVTAVGADTVTPVVQDIAAATNGPDVLVHRDMTSLRPQVQVLFADGSSHVIEVVSQIPELQPRPQFMRLGPSQLAGALLLPSDDDGTSSLPVVLDPYGGPHAQRVLGAASAYSSSQWLADQGFAVLIVDGRGTPGRGPVFERGVHMDLATPVLDDQIAALEAAAEREPRLDLSRVGIRGWSFGGYLAALALLRRPDVFHAGVAGAPVTDWQLYDTHYTERYLGHPADSPEAYRVSSLVDSDLQLSDAADWGPRPPALMLIHGLADDNVVAAHSVRLSSALLAAGRPHQFLPLSGVTHMTPQEVVAERLLTEQVRFLRASLTGTSAEPVTDRSTA